MFLMSSPLINPLIKMSNEAAIPFNKQLYENSGLAELFEVTEKTGGLFNSRAPNLAILHEKPEHRLLLWMKAQGASNREIAQQSGYTEPWISQLFRQPWAQSQLVEMMKEAGMDVTKKLLEAACPDSIMKLIELRDDPVVYANYPSVVRASCVDLIQQYLGKPKQQVDVVSTPTRDINSLDDELAKNEKEINRLQGVAI